MYIFRWLMKNPAMIIVLYALSIVAILYSMTGGDKPEQTVDTIEKVELKETDSSGEPSIEPSTLSNDLVKGKVAEEKPSDEKEVAKAVETSESNKAEEASVEEVIDTAAVDASATEEKPEAEAQEVEVKTETAEEASVEEVTDTAAVDASATEEKPEAEAQEVVVKTETAEVVEVVEVVKAETEGQVVETDAVVVTASEEKLESEAKTEPKEDVASSDTPEVVLLATAEVSTEAEISTGTENSSIETDTQFSEMDAAELLLMAREAYWNNGLEESAEIYQQLISTNPDVIDYKGELGNVYWRQGFPKKAAELYAEISLPMIEEGNVDKVANMVGFIGLFYPEKATEIHNILQAGK